MLLAGMLLFPIGALLYWRFSRLMRREHSDAWHDVDYSAPKWWKSWTGGRFPERLVQHALDKRNADGISPPVRRRARWTMWVFLVGYSLFGGGGLLVIVCAPPLPPEAPPEC